MEDETTEGTSLECVVAKLSYLEDQVALLTNVIANRVLASDARRDADYRVQELPPPDHMLLAFTHKQHATLQMLALGEPNQKIADVLEVSESTAKVHVRAIMKKLNVHTRSDVAQIFREMVSKWTPDEYQRVAGIEKDWAINPDRYPATTRLLREGKNVC